MFPKLLLAAPALVVGLLFVPQAAPAHVGHPAGPPSMRPAGKALFTGVVRDSTGRALDDVNVEAFEVGGSSSVPAASALTYADRNGYRPHGAYELHVHTGVYLLKFSVLPDSGRHLRTTYFGGGTGTPLVINPREQIHLGDVRMLPDGPSSSTTRVKLQKSNIKRKQHAWVRVTVSSPQVKPVTGAVRVLVDGVSVDLEKMNRRDDGTVRVELPLQSVGVHRVQAAYLGSSLVGKSQSSSVLLGVTRR